MHQQYGKEEVPGTGKLPKKALIFGQTTHGPNHSKIACDVRPQALSPKERGSISTVVVGVQQTVQVD